MSFKIEKVEQPKRVKTATKVYDDLIASMEKKEAGWYKVTIENKKSSTIYQQLSKKMKDKKDMITLHKVSGEVYIQKLETKKK